MSDSAAEERKAKAAERQARLLAKSQARLEKITGAAKGEGRIISDSAVGIAPSPKQTTAAASPRAPTSLADINNQDDPAEIDLAALHGAKGLQQQFAALSGGAGGAGGEMPEGGDLFSQMMAQMAAGGGPNGAAGGQNPFAGLAGLAGGADGSNPFANSTAGGGQPPVSPFAPPPPKTFLDKLFPLLHLLAMVGLAVYAVVWWEPSKRFGLYGASETQGIDWAAWGALASRRPKDAGVVGQVVGMQLAEIPLLWMFISIELVLQTSRIFLLRNRPSAPGMLSSILPLLSQFSPQLGLVLQTGTRYLALFSTCLNDLAVLVFCIGIVILIGHYKTGAPGGTTVQIVKEATNSILEKAKGDL
ncbi:uncharacterized protein JCM6883_006611 [Sporobolomyces salmoneus]|uniref:uncharacterized protein n=1 Tax=Sporobolomyces salmoneus TaxID=183962 RepID=UPI00316D0303